MPEAMPATADATTLQRHYELERALADRLRQASAGERQGLYTEVYNELFRQFPELGEHDAEASRELAKLQGLLIESFLRPQTRYLEIGSGDSTLALSLARRVERVFALEASEVVSEADEVPDNFHLVLTHQLEPTSDAGLVDVGLIAGSIDLAFSCHFVEHLHRDDLRSHLRQVLNFLRPGAPYVCVTPSRLYGPHDISRYFTEQPTGLHLEEYAHRDLAKELRQAGFAKVEALRGIGEPARTTSLLPFQLIETALDVLPRGLRRWVLAELPYFRNASAPFRPLEQVKLVGWKSESGPR